MSDNKLTTEVIVEARSLGKQVESPGGGYLDILSEVSLEIKTAETLAITGASGSGKSTLLGLLAGLDQPTSGAVYLAGQSLEGMDEDERARLRGQVAGFVFQSFHLLPSLTALENVMLPLELAGHKKARIMAKQSLERVGLSDRTRHYPGKLSGGEQQRVAIARAFVTHPRILFADEPTGNLDQQTGSRVSDLLFEMNREHGTTLVLVTHDLNLAGRCSRSVIIANGRLRAEV
ncbi:ABC transporter ATP-binding protein [Endozoicomonas sp. Mp262]|uniref:ABC transporter ATP-binding protein n=1 Tax=Endozoicomonas sp. Mp262 TaxID=2919499 RepID=UPI0021DAEF8B